MIQLLRWAESNFTATQMGRGLWNWVYGTCARKGFICRKFCLHKTLVGLMVYFLGGQSWFCQRNVVNHLAALRRFSSIVSLLFSILWFLPLFKQKPNGALRVCLPGKMRLEELSSFCVLSNGPKRNVLTPNWATGHIHTCIDTSLRENRFSKTFFLYNHVKMSIWAL